MKAYFKQIGANVRKVRMSRGLTLRELGVLAKMDYTNVCRFEQGNRDIYLSTLKTLADALKCDVKDFL